MNKKNTIKGVKAWAITEQLFNTIEGVEMTRKEAEERANKNFLHRIVVPCEIFITPIIKVAKNKVGK